MKRLIFILLVASSCSYAQPTEFTQYSNGLIYDESTMNRLEIIVDSLNVRFRACDLAHPYYSFPQGNASWLEVPSKAARKLIESGITFDEFIKKYPDALKRKNIWITKNYYTNYKNENIIQYSGLPQGYGSEPKLNLKQKRSNDKTSGWLLNDDGTKAFYIDTLREVQLPFSYARLVQYVDCMIDTTATIYFPEAEGNTYRTVNPDSKAAQFLTLANNYPREPKRPDYDDKKTEELDFDSLYEVYASAYTVWDSLRLLHVDAKMKSDNYWKSLFADAVQESIDNTDSDAAFEFYVLRYGNKSDALKLMRSRKVVGYCSQDMSPRYHAMNICMAAAETAQWDIFLRSHLDIMNDRFERMSDGSYAWAGRKTYLQELEELDIPAVDLLLGTSLRVSNVSDNHYWGSISRVGRALTDARDKDAVENQLLTMMQDPALDIYNRLLIAFVFDHYTHNLDESPRKETNKQRLETALETMPQQIQDVWRKKKS
jgi:hypothetical protein